MSREEKLLWVIALILGVMWCGGSVLAAVPRTISYQGYLKDSAGKPITAATSLTFRLYSTTSGVNPVWSESRSVTPVNGVYAVGLGETSPLPIPFNRQYYLGVQAGVDPELRPLQMLMAAPYALHAGCNPGDMLNCYTGPPETMNVGLCKSGVRSCASDGNGFGACIGEFAPNCGGICLDLSSNAANCGTCGNACPTVSNGTPRCSGGVCGYTCTVGWGDCDPTQPMAARPTCRIIRTTAVPAERRVPAGMHAASPFASTMRVRLHFWRTVRSLPPRHLEIATPTNAMVRVKS